MTLHAGIADTPTQHCLHAVEFAGIGAPEVRLVYIDTIVVTEFVTLIDKFTSVVWTCCVKVILHTWVCDRIITDGIRVYVVEYGSAEHILHGLIMAIAVSAEHDTCSQARLLGQLGIQGR